jgi:hypothetical protein
LFTKETNERTPFIQLTKQACPEDRLSRFIRAWYVDAHEIARFRNIFSREDRKFCTKLYKAYFHNWKLRTGMILYRPPFLSLHLPTLLSTSATFPSLLSLPCLVPVFSLSMVFPLTSTHALAGRTRRKMHIVYRVMWREVKKSFTGWARHLGGILWMRERLWQLQERSFRRVLRLCLTGADAEHTQDTRKHMQRRELTRNGTGLIVIWLFYVG